MNIHKATKRRRELRGVNKPCQYLAFKPRFLRIGKSVLLFRIGIFRFGNDFEDRLCGKCVRCSYKEDSWREVRFQSCYYHVFVGLKNGKRFNHFKHGLNFKSGYQILLLSERRVE